MTLKLLNLASFSLENRLPLYPSTSHLNQLEAKVVELMIDVSFGLTQCWTILVLKEQIQRLVLACGACLLGSASVATLVVQVTQKTQHCQV